MNNDELIASGHELAKCLDSNTPLIDIAKMIVRLADKLDVTTAALRKKTKQCNELANELNAVEAIHNDAVFITDENYDQCPPEVQKIISKLAVMVLPATDAFMREVRAQGVEMFADSKYCQDESQSGAHEFAVELRQGGAA
ncbi:TPA: hypothetical protein PTV77_003101 [Cronobacter sakazakii]|nr:hypothetical protein [Cronobacter sakazakii]